MNPSRRPARLAGAFALALVLASCTGSPDPAPTPSSSATSTDVAPDSTTGPVEQLQLEVIGAVDDEAWARLEHERFEAVVARCMQEAGFEYTPEEYFTEDDKTDTETLAYAREHGYGITTSDDLEEDEELPPMPNDEYVSGLSDEEMEAYWLALEGELDDDLGDEGIDLEDFVDEDGEIDLGDLEMGEDGELDLGDLEGDLEDDFGDGFDELDDLGYGGCQGEAYEALLADPLPYDRPEHQDVLAALDEMYAELAEDEGFLAAEEAWASCMEAAGYPDLVTSEDAEYLVFDAYEEAWEQVPEDADDLTPELLAEVQALELEVATADYECRESSGLTTAYRDAQHAAEQAFVEAHRDALVAYFEDMGAVLEG